MFISDFLPIFLLFIVLCNGRRCPMLKHSHPSLIPFRPGFFFFWSLVGYWTFLTCNNMFNIFCMEILICLTSASHYLFQSIKESVLQMKCLPSRARPLHAANGQAFGKGKPLFLHTTSSITFRVYSRVCRTKCNHGNLQGETDSVCCYPHLSDYCVLPL